MLCFLCGKKIGLLRSITDQQYCSNEHRQDARLASAQAIRDEEDQDSWAAERSRRKSKAAGKPASGVSQTASVFAFLGVGALLVAALLLPGPQAAGPSSFPAISAERTAKQGILERAGDAVGGFLRTNAPITLQTNFSGGSLASAMGTLSDWTSVNLRTGPDAGDFSVGPRTSLRLWSKSTAMQNYQMQFQAQMEKTSLHWAVRAADGANFYATRLAITKSGSPNASVIKYTMINGLVSDYTQTALPLTLHPGKDYNVRVSVQDNQVLAYLNGQLVSTLFDKRLTRGGVGFFDDADDPQKVSWISVSERDSFLGRMMAHFGLFMVPGDPTSLE